jgi:hypothetical protein
VCLTAPLAHGSIVIILGREITNIELPAHVDAVNADASVFGQQSVNMKRPGSPESKRAVKRSRLR